jgi:uncharacterized protein YndB with AHSA1/START domain
MIIVNVIIKRPVEDVWNYFTNISNWSKWNGGSIIQVKWEKGGYVTWGMGSPAHIDNYEFQKLVTIVDTWIDTSYRFAPCKEGTLFTIEEGSPKNASWSDGGVKHTHELEDSLKKFKQNIESSRKIEAVESTVHIPENISPDDFIKQALMTSLLDKLMNIGSNEHLEEGTSSLSDNDYAVLHLSRPKKLVGAMISYDVNLDDTVVYRAKNDSKTSIKIIREGKHVLSAKTESRATLPINVIFGEEYYVQCSLGMGFFVGHPKLELVKTERKSAPENTPVKKVDAEQPLQQTSRKVRPNVPAVEEATNYIVLAREFACYFSFRINDSKEQELKARLLAGGDVARKAITDFLLGCGRGMETNWWQNVHHLVQLIKQFPGDSESVLNALIQQESNIWEYQTHVKDVAKEELDELKAANNPVVSGVDKAEHIQPASISDISVKEPEPEPNVRPNVPDVPELSSRVTFVRESREASYVWMIHQAANKADAMEFLSQQQIDKPFYYMVVETPEGNFGRDEDGIYTE